MNLLRKVSKLSGFLLQGLILLSAFSFSYGQVLDFQRLSVAHGRNLLIRSRGNLLSAIPSFYSYRYDVSVVSSRPSYIGDGGSDMYDNGNYVTVQEGTRSYRAVYNRAYNFPNSQFTSWGGHPFFSLLRIDNSARRSITYTLRVNGNAGADGRVRPTRYSRSLSDHGFTIQYHTFQISGASDPSICEVYFTVHSRTVWGSVASNLLYSFGTSSDTTNNVVTLRGTPSRMFLGYMLLSKARGASVSNAQVDAAMRIVLNTFARISTNFAYSLPAVNTYVSQSSRGLSSLIPSWYSYRYDGNARTVPNYISDGGGDMFDGGNRVIASEGSRNYQVVYGRDHSFTYARFRSYPGHPFLAVFMIDNPYLNTLTHSIAVTGNPGSDGSGRGVTLNGVMRVGTSTIEYRSYQINGARDPSICEVYFIIYDTANWNSRKPRSIQYYFRSNTHNLNNRFTIVGEQSRMVMGYTLLSRTSGSALGQGEIQNALRGTLYALVGGSVRLPFSLTTGVASMSRSSSRVTRSIRNWFSYRYDGNAASLPNYINDGGYDMYDGGNRIVVNEGSRSYRVRYGQAYNFPNSQFRTVAGHPFFALLRIENPNLQSLTYTFRVYGNAGADNSGSVSTFSGAVTSRNFTLEYHVFQIPNGGDPTICEVYFILHSRSDWFSTRPSSFTPRFGRSTDALDNRVTLSGTPSRMVMGYTLLSRRPNSLITTTEVRNVMLIMLNALSGVSINECATGQHNCHRNAVCTDTADGFTCRCNAGYTGNGVTCADVNECTSRTHRCHRYATCTNTVGSYTCRCNTGYTGNGVSCTDINECNGNGHNCHDNARCVNILGNYTCTCNTGYRGNGYVCAEIDECFDGTHGCDVNATCSNNNGSYTCSCNAGYSGSGVNCSDVDECTASTDNCHSNAACANNDGSFTCTCNPGYTGNGTHCSDIDECGSASNPHNCDENADCTNTNGSFTCACNTGFNGNGTQCTDIDECASDATNNCHEHARCRNTDGDFTCECNGGYAGDGTNCTDAFSIVCSPTSMALRILSRYFIDKSIELEDLHFRDYSCGGVVDSSSPDTWVFNIATLSSCSIERTSNSTHVIYTNTLSNSVRGGLLVAGRGERIRFSCAYAKDLDDLTLTTQYGVIRSIANLTAPSGEGVFEAELNHFTDDSHNTPETREEFEPSDTLYIMMELRTSDPTLTLVIDRCWITPTPNITHEHQYTFIDDGCPVSNASGNVEITQSGVGHRAHFESAMFAYVDYNTTFLHCSLEICSSADGDSCVPSCLRRSKRSLSSNALSRTKRQASEQEEILSIGPFTVVRGEPGDGDSLLPHTGLSLTVLVAILVAVVIVVIACLAFAAFWYRGTRISRLNKLEPVVFTNPALTSD